MVDDKVDYPAACNAVEKVLLHSSWVTKEGGLAKMCAAFEAAGVTVHGGAVCLVAELKVCEELNGSYSAQLWCCVVDIDPVW